MEYSSKTEIYQKVKKPMLERQRRARINKCLDALKTLVADLQQNDAILRMDKAEMLEAAVTFIRNKVPQKPQQQQQQQQIPLESFQNGYMNAVNEVSRVMAATNGMNVELGKSVMTHLGRVYKNLQQFHEAQAQQQQQQQQLQTPLSINCGSSVVPSAFSPASSGYHSDDCESNSAASPIPVPEEKLWRPW